MQETNLYTMIIPPMTKAMGALSKILDKAAAHATAKATERRPASYFEERLLQSQLIFDQFPLVMQIQRVSDNAKNGAARLAGIEPPTMEDNEKTVAALKARLQRTSAFLDTIKPEQVIGREDARVTLPYWKDKHLSAFDYATEYLMPNFYFHYATAYSILRANGIEIGKNDYIGGLPLKDS
ncbi:hypothetical protein A3C21_01195 [Candidatus Kaiserbacteria bacterium RIFCSPHIGHO2_02_FULL_59_21]|uniref:DUF1993 domain-containing protein n=1 Tax=Candidatus Kaiserbacteria bacterium RIFCSPHIGHO2_02_FULL_59_21 TaxID=1798500 RepID=A0A1F6E2F4_9BACT|nr:MAG: hypothetical protein A2766_01925 [Candidatus Kaiserbacteria bacterium RIFCSPHIGHO2_01_FULL_58_22]OGG67412.1 MAG: hypothetical protein A3C21_01195 [Candidatus Kaiserbacteria bacterium RIFCSPHIGHO2_02_FULL_59_21]OGG80261.1 MAG: hypothetical protein A2952_01830 [Candidatus Kaiserbacteria bacterium RIFCSPLOWO2_01_FULL_59_34]OGG85788.1 MAG: hypothetical protein A3I47_00110 [Candidatus Kaiserbacteria bacterium RIFCSPLOWO2_02_FULL_59_19]